jgi:RHH-type proline utilization regulon transcriptional repressor/proline dehydrogenase/delta 1-pyrroline-5-carboxylate dehydrogenase
LVNQHGITPTAGQRFGACARVWAPLAGCIGRAVGASTKTAMGTDPSIQLEALLADFRPIPGSPRSLEAQQAVHLARRLQTRANCLQTRDERRQQEELDRMLQHPEDKVALVQMTDQAFRSRSAPRAVDQFTHILDVQGIPRFFNPLDRTLLRGFQSFGSYLPEVAAPLVKDRMQKETANVILPGERELLLDHLRRRQTSGLRMNVNFLGEAVLSDAEAQRRLEHYLEALTWPEIEVVSVKISTLDSQLSPLARDRTLRVLCERLELLYRTAARSAVPGPDGAPVTKFVYLDMEEYRDVLLTAEAFMRTLELPGLESVAAGIALQAYLPDSIRTQRVLTAWAQQRVAAGGAAITIRIVKGANLEMERVEASLRQWPQAPFLNKAETDANYKRMLGEGMQASHLAAARLGIASHNLFDLAYGLVLTAHAQAWERVQFEMLEGMAAPQRRALAETGCRILLYAPVCAREKFLYALGYLIRRLDENTGPDNFLRHAFRLTVDSADWCRLEAGFLGAFERIHGLPDAARRTQDRNATSPVTTSSAAAPGAVATVAEPRVPDPEPHAEPGAHAGSSHPITGLAEFENEPDTDWSLPQNVAWAQSILAHWAPRHGANAAEIPLVIGGEALASAGAPPRHCLDPSRPGVCVGRYRTATINEIERAAGCAAADPDAWRRRPPAERGAVLSRVAGELRRARATLLGAALANAGKTLTEGDAEVSEAVDFVEYYARSAMAWHALSNPRLQVQGRGAVAVFGPWNFPIAIPCGGVAAALAAGNTVVLKPASDAVLVAWELCQCFWRGGISQRTLQFVPCAGGTEGRRLAGHPAVDTVVLTGGTATAQAILREHPQARLSAETGGKNATIVTAMADRDQAIKHVLHSAFSHAGQKCSATSLLLLEAEVYDDPEFQRTLREAIESLPVGSAWDLATRINPLIRPPAGDLEAALKTLESGESWAVWPCQVGDNPNLWSPGLKWGVQPGSFTHRTEFFGPLLGVMRFDKLPVAIDRVNATGYGLTSGLESLDDREHALWRARVQAGNLYINRPTVGAIVQRQPFGGFGKSAFGPGLKAGGPNYVAHFFRFTEPAPAADPDPRDLVLPVLSDPFLESLARGVAADAALPAAPAPVAAGDAAEPSGDRPSLSDAMRLLTALASYEAWFHSEFNRLQDPTRLLGQDNLLRYLPVSHVRVCMHPEDTWFEVVARVCAARRAGCQIVVSLPPGVAHRGVGWLDHATRGWGAALELIEESEEALAKAVLERQTDRLRYAASERVPVSIRRAAAEVAAAIVDQPVLVEGRVELLWYFREQTISVDYHRYGHLGARAGEPGRRPGPER